MHHTGRADVLLEAPGSISGVGHQLHLGKGKSETIMTTAETMARNSLRRLSAPVMINLELTSGCNLNCRYCYNFWREDGGGRIERMSRERMRRLVDMIVADGVFHVVLTGGEPFLNFEVLVEALALLHEAGISTSVNSNLTLADERKVGRLREVGLDHVLTSLHSADPEVSDAVAGRQGAHAQTVRGIRQARAAGLRVSANMIVSDRNQDHVLPTARLCADLGVQRIFGTRLVPSVNVEDPAGWEFHLGRKAARRVLDDLIEARDELGIAVGTLISYPLCLLGDLDRYADFVGRGCPAQRGNRMVINADGEAHACTHESHSYGNVFDEGISGVFRRMHAWHDGSYINGGCSACAYVGVCRSGCRMAAQAYTKAMDGPDPLSGRPEDIRTPYRMTPAAKASPPIDPQETFRVPDSIRFRREDGFWVVNIRWANTINVREDLGRMLRRFQKENRPFTRAAFDQVGGDPELLSLLAKEVVLPGGPGRRNVIDQKAKAGCSIDPEELPWSAAGER